MTNGVRVGDMRKRHASRASLVSVIMLLFTMPFGPVSGAPSDSQISEFQFDFFQVDGYHSTDILNLNGTANMPLHTAQWRIHDHQTPPESPSLLAGDYLSSVTPSGEQRWSWTLVVDVSQLNCTCVLTIIQGDEHHSPRAQIHLYLGETGHRPILQQPVHSTYLLAGGELEIDIEAITPSGTLNDSLITFTVCEAPNAVCLKEPETMKLNSTLSDQLHLRLNASTLPLADGIWKITVVLSDRTLTASNSISYTLQLDRHAPVVVLTSSVEQSQASLAMVDDAPSEPVVYEGEEVFFTAEVTDGYEGESEVLTWSKISPNGQVSTFSEASFITPASVTLLPDVAGEWSVVLLVRDSAGHLVRTTSTFTVTNAAPVAQVFLDGLQIQQDDVLVAPSGDSWVLNASKTTDTSNDVSSLRFQWFVDGTLIQTQGAVFDSAQINTTGSHKMELVVIDDDEAESRLAFSLDIPQDQVSGSEGMLGGNYFTLGLVFIIGVAGLLLAKMGSTEPETSLPKWQRKK